MKCVISFSPTRTSKTMKLHGRGMARIVLITLLIIAIPGVADARNQRCVVGTLKEDTIQDYALIIAGQVIERDKSDRMDSGFALTSWGRNTVRVLKGWKGAEKGDQVAIHRNERWGDGFSPGNKYIIFAEHEDDDEPQSPLVAPVCSHTQQLGNAGRLVKGLEKYFSRQPEKDVKVK